MAPEPLGAPQRGRCFRRQEAAVYLKEIYGIHCAPRTLAKLAVIGGGPEMQYAGRFPLYSEDSLDRYAKKKLSPPVASTSELRALRQGGA